MPLRRGIKMILIAAGDVFRFMSGKGSYRPWTGFQGDFPASGRPSRKVCNYGQVKVRKEAKFLYLLIFIL
jgi:hypothetical protein